MIIVEENPLRSFIEEQQAIVFNRKLSVKCRRNYKHEFLSIADLAFQNYTHHQPDLSFEETLSVHLGYPGPVRFYRETDVDENDQARYVERGTALAVGKDCLFAIRDGYTLYKKVGKYEKLRRSISTQRHLIGRDQELIDAVMAGRKLLSELRGTYPICSVSHYVSIPETMLTFG